MIPPAGRVTPAAAERLMTDPGPYLSCDECFEQVDTRVEALLAGVAEPLTPAFRGHLLGCAACLDEASSLAELAAQDAGLDPETVRTRLEQALESGGPALT
jgi:hypothetical protein